MSKSAFSFVVLLLTLLISSPLWAGEAYWIDVRSQGEYEAGHVEGAINIPHTEITGRIAGVTEDKTTPLYLYCRSGRRSSIATDALQQMGYSHVVNVGGYEDARTKAAQINAK